MIISVMVEQREQNDFIISQRFAMTFQRLEAASCTVKTL